MRDALNQGNLDHADLERKAVVPYVFMMSTLKITAKGQVTLRKELLQHLGAAPGDTVQVEKSSGGRIELRAARSSGKMSDAFGFLKRDDGPRLTIEEIGTLAAEGWAGKRR